LAHLHRLGRRRVRARPRTSRMPENEITASARCQGDQNAQGSMKLHNEMELSIPDSMNPWPVTKTFCGLRFTRENGALQPDRTGH